MNDRTTPNASSPSIDPGMGPDLLRRMDTPGPRYTSYPTADRFRAGFAASTWQQALAARLGSTQPLSLYLHLPFCASVCYYCACNKVVTKHHSRARPYLAALHREIDLVCAAMGTRQRVEQLHLGGGTPTFLSDEELAELMQRLEQAFDFEPDAERAIEIDPRTVDMPRLARLRAIGFNRISLGVQDVDTQVQQAVHRVQPLEQVAALLEGARSLGFESTNVDLIYGLPRQTPRSVAQTVAQIAALAPDRVALYGYAHLPERFAPQRRIDTTTLPSAGERLAMLHNALKGFGDAGYVHIGMDHFARPQDALAKAKRAGTLKRNFQGYSVHSGGDVLALGVSAISHVAGHYAQNGKQIEAYEASLAAGELPVTRGWVMSAEDVLRRELIMGLMCQGRIDVPALEARHGICFALHFAPQTVALQRFVRDGMLREHAQGYSLTALGWYFVRAVAMLFDEHLSAPVSAGQDGARFSRVV
jgi:oxygen-independent coproporphyrinogen-3 oxidase